MGYLSVEQGYPVTDCPDHPSCALTFPAGTFCFACGREVHAADGVILTEAWTTDAPDALKAEARAAWNDSQGVRDFSASMQRAAGATPLERKAS